MAREKPKILKNTKIEYNGKTYENIVNINRSYDYSYFDYIDESGSRISVSLRPGKEFSVINKES